MELDVRHIDLSMGEGKRARTVLGDVSFSVPDGAFCSLLGESGAGKSTILKVIAGILLQDGGSVLFDGQDIVALDDHARTKLRRERIGFVFQSVALIPMMTALENVEYALRLARYKGDRRERALECLRLVGLSARQKHMPQELSGGEQQRVAIARAIAHRPRVIFADEPTGELDTVTGLQVVKIFKDLTAQEGVTIVMTTHDVGLMEIGDAVYELEGGEVVSHGE